MWLKNWELPLEEYKTKRQLSHRLQINGKQNTQHLKIEKLTQTPERDIFVFLNV